MKTLYAIAVLLALALPLTVEAQSMICKLGICYTVPSPTPAPTVCYDDLKRVVSCTPVRNPRG